MISVLIPSKNEPYLEKTIEDVQKHAVGEIEVLAEEDPGIGQRALCNKLARKAKGEWLMKLDAHCSMAYGFDEEMIKDADRNVILAPYLMVLDPETWTIKPNKKSSAYVFDTEYVTHYGDENKEIVNETMCLQGSCFMTHRDTWFDWNICDEELGSWGHQGTELGIAAFINGGVCKTTKRTFYGHVFRHAEMDFPYKRDENAINDTHKKAKEKFSTYNLQPLIDKYDYPCNWRDVL